MRFQGVVDEGPRLVVAVEYGDLVSRRVECVEAGLAERVDFFLEPVRLVVDERRDVVHRVGDADQVVGRVVPEARDPALGVENLRLVVRAVVGVLGGVAEGVGDPDDVGRAGLVPVARGRADAVDDADQPPGVVVEVLRDVADLVCDLGDLAGGVGFQCADRAVRVPDSSAAGRTSSSR